MRVFFKFCQKSLFGRMPHAQKVFSDDGLCTDYISQQAVPFLKISGDLDKIYRGRKEKCQKVVKN